jgi:HEAT repeat protein
MSSSVVCGRVLAAGLLVPAISLCVGCNDPAPPAVPARQESPVAVVDVVEVEELAASNAQDVAVIEDVRESAVGPSSDRVTKLIQLLEAAGTDSRTRVVTIDELAAIQADATATLKPLLAALADAEPGVRWHAARAIGLLGKAAVPAVPSLVKLLTDPDPVVVTQAAAAIGHIRTDDDRELIPEADAAVYAAAVEPLVATMVHPDPRARRATIRALRRVSTSRQELAQTVRKQLADADPIAVIPALHTLADLGAEAVPFLVESLEDPASRYWAEVVLAEIGPGAAPAVDALTKLVGEGEIAERVQSILALAEIGPAAAPAAGAIAEALGSPDQSLQYVAAFALGKIKASGVDEPLDRAVGSEDPFLATLASWALATIHPDDDTLLREAATRLQGGLESDSPAVRNAAVEGLSDLAPRFDETGRRELAASFTDLLVDPVPSVGLAAGGGLIRMGGDSVVALQAAMGEPTTRADALEILAALGPQALPALADIVKALDDADPVCRGDAALAIAAIGPAAESAVPALERVLGDEAVAASVRYPAAYALGKIGAAASSAGPLLEKLAESDDNLLATVAVWAALKITPHDKNLSEMAIPKLRRALQDGQEIVRLEAAVTLGEIGRPAASALPVLEMLAEDDPSAPVRAAAEAALGLIRE